MTDSNNTFITFQSGAKLKNDEAARFLRYERFTLRNSRHTGKLAGVEAPKYSKQGKTILYDLDDLIKWRDQFEVRTCTRDVGTTCE